MQEITFVITSSNRFDLLARTLDSFIALNDYPIARYILNEDSGNVECAKKILSKYGDRFHVLYHPHREGLSRALDNLFKQVQTEYVFTCEDDWFFSGNKNFLLESMDIMETHPYIKQVWIRDSNDHQHPLGKAHSIRGIQVRDVLKGYQGHWGGFTFNPSLRRISDYKKYFPNGFAEFGDEADCSRQAERMDYKAVSLVNYACKHIGWNRHTQGFKV